MFPSTRRIINFRPETTTTTTTTQQSYFLIVMTNYPNLLQRAHEHQPSNQVISYEMMSACGERESVKHNLLSQ